MERPTASSSAKKTLKDQQKKPEKPESTQRTTRSVSDFTTSKHTVKTRTELYGIGKYTWKTEGVDGTRTHLIMKGFISGDCDPNPSLATLVLVLLRAVAFILEERRDNKVLKIAETLNGIDTNLLKVLAYAEQEKEGPAPINAGENGLAEVLEKAEKSVTNTGERVPSGPKGRTYAAAVASGTKAPPQHVIALANAHAGDCQVMVVLSEKELVEKASLALEHAKSVLGDDTAPDRMGFVGAKRVWSGAVVFHLTAAEWLQLPRCMNAFLMGLGGTAIYKPRNYSVVVEFVLVTFDPALRHAFRTLEDDNGLERDVITQERYIKPLERRHVGQHTIFGFATAEGANHAIRHRLFVHGKRVTERKLLSEPIRCMKCQMIGTTHNAATCPSIHDTSHVLAQTAKPLNVLTEATEWWTATAPCL
ncbi:hypothetical protein DFH07DRAFT_965205 [Mycena maculata]|uniref:Uncharacterized protein n=1 Tax=Mycena maculata TaxID=230809 RepID=A0AAD7IDJ2_9AGAR|nr:hypothetical protein DFH07DRAFT_965205 [Mycena maculata]